MAPDVEHGAANSIGDNIDWSAVSEEVLLNYRVQTNNNFNLPGWKEFASDLYSMSRDLYFMWKDSGSPMQGELFNMKNRAKARFKGAMRFIRCNEDALRKDSLAKKTAV